MFKYTNVMLEHLESIRNKPKHVRGQYAFWSSLILTVLIVSVWGLFQRDRFSSGDAEAQEILQETESSFFGELGEIFGGVRAIPSMFKGRVEYSKEEVKIVAPKTIDLDAMVASSTRAEFERMKNASTTPESVDSSEL